MKMKDIAFKAAMVLLMVVLEMELLAGCLGSLAVALAAVGVGAIVLSLLAWVGALKA